MYLQLLSLTLTTGTGTFARVKTATAPADWSVSGAEVNKKDRSPAAEAATACPQREKHSCQSKSSLYCSAVSSFCASIPNHNVFSTCLILGSQKEAGTVQWHFIMSYKDTYKVS